MNVGIELPSPGIGSGFAGMVLAAGLGMRLRPFTDHHPKPLFPVFDRTLLHMAIRALVSAGIYNIVVNAFHLPEQIEEVVGEAHEAFPGVRVRVSREEKLLGTGGGIAQARRHFGDLDVVVVNGDVVADWDVRGLCELHRRSGAAVTLEVESGKRHPRLRSTLVGASGLVEAIKTEDFRGPDYGVFSGMYILSSEAYWALGGAPGSVVSGLIGPLVAKGRVYGTMRSFAWCDLGTWERVSGWTREVLCCEGHWREVLGETLGEFRMADCGQGGACYVGPDVRLDGEAGTHSVLGRGCWVKAGCLVERSIVLPGCVVGESIRDRIVGDGWWHLLP